MGFFESLLYGFVQGATEYLPVSSSAHLLLLPHILGTPDPGLAFDVILHFGTLLATAVYFFKDWMIILMNPFPRALKGEKQHLSWVHLGIGTLPAVITGVVLNHWIQDHTRSLVVLWFTLPLFGILLWAVDKKSLMNREIQEVTLKDMLMIGCMQSLALIPGVSRSGSTITAARARGFNRADSARISFLLSLPVTLGAILYEARHWNEIVASVQGVAPLLGGCLSALIFGALSIHLLIKWVSRTSFTVFAVYRVFAAILIAVLLGRN